jgi:CRP/FNR family transcriptional regulator, cyclic AMP receptor protein
MEIFDLHHSQRESLDALVSSFVLIKQVYQQDPAQFESLLRQMQLLHVKPGEVIIDVGQEDMGLYFLLKGQLVVYAGVPPLKKVHTITPGEMFGDVAVLLRDKRSATVIADVRVKISSVLRVDFEIFGALADMSRVNLAVKLIFYRNIVHNLRWKLEVYRTHFPQHACASGHHKIRLFSGSRDTLEELLSLDEQARQLAQLLNEWNRSLVND